MMWLIENSEIFPRFPYLWNRLQSLITLITSAEFIFSLLAGSWSACSGVFDWVWSCLGLDSPAFISPIKSDLSIKMIAGMLVSASVNVLLLQMRRRTWRLISRIASPWVSDLICLRRGNFIMACDSLSSWCYGETLAGDGRRIWHWTAERRSRGNNTTLSCWQIPLASKRLCL